MPIYLGDKLIAGGGSGVGKQGEGENSVILCDTENNRTPAPYSAAIGMGLITNGDGWDGQIVLGQYNEEIQDALFIIGNGTSSSEDDRHNAMTIGFDGADIDINQTVLINDSLYVSDNIEILESSDLLDDLGNPGNKGQVITSPQITEQGIIDAEGNYLENQKGYIIWQLA